MNDIPPVPPQWENTAPSVSPNGRVVRLGETIPIQPAFVERPLLQAATFHLFAGRLGVGKGALIMRWIARCTNGEMYGRPRNALLLSSEEDPARDLMPRIMVAGGDPMRVVMIPNTFLLPRDMDWLYAHVEEVGDVGFVALDPLSNHIGGTNSNADEEVRLALQPLAIFAGEVDAPTVGVRHVSSKEAKGGFIARILGSTAWPAVPRVVLGVGKDEDAVLHVRTVKGNRLRDEEAGMRFRLEGAQFLDWEESVVLAVDDGVSTIDIDGLLEDRKDSNSEKARQAIIRLVREAGGQIESDVLDGTVAAETGVTARTVQKLRMELRDRGWLRHVPINNPDGTRDHWDVTLTNFAPYDRDLDPDPSRARTQESGVSGVSGEAESHPNPDTPHTPEIESGEQGHLPLDEPDAPSTSPTCPVCGSTNVGALSGRCRDCGSKVTDGDPDLFRGKPVTLTAEEQARAEAAGAARYDRRRAEGSRQRHGRLEADHSTVKEIEAIGAEMAAGRVIGVEWQDSSTPDPEGDLGPGVQVRHTVYSTGRLLVHPSDEDEHRFILVTGPWPSYIVRGWEHAAVVKRDGVWEELQPGRPAHTLRQEQLRGMEEWT